MTDEALPTVRADLPTAPSAPGDLGAALPTAGTGRAGADAPSALAPALPPALASEVCADLPSVPTAEPLPASAGARLARGVGRALGALGFACLEEVTLASGLRVDVMALGPKGEIWIVECKSSRADYLSDGKWRGYLEYCDRFFWAVGAEFPVDLLPEGTGLILADAYGGEVLRQGPETPLPGARRKAVTLRFARAAAGRLQGLRDPGGREALGRA